MTFDAAQQPRPRRWGPLLAVAIVVAALAWLAFSGIGGALVYYKTPTELKAMGASAIGQSIRVGGLVTSLHCREVGDVSFVITDGHSELQVLNGDGASLICPRENVGAVVQGKLSTLGVFEASQVIIKHDENYVAPSPGVIPSHNPGP